MLCLTRQNEEYSIVLAIGLHFRGLDLQNGR